MTKTPDDEVPEEMLIAAIERDTRHRHRENRAVPVWAVMEHLVLPRRSMRARRVRARLDALTAEGVLENARIRSVETWLLTRSGRQRLRRARLADRVPTLPESPQHRDWRTARMAATQEIDRFRQKLRETLDEATGLLLAGRPAESDAWFGLSERLRDEAWRLGSATYCLYEWAEPVDEQADIDDHRNPSDAALAEVERERWRYRRRGRRNISLWRG